MGNPNPAVDEAFQAVNRASDAAMIVVTTAAEGHRAGCLVGFHSQAGIDPQRYCVWLSKANDTYRTALRATDFAVHFLTREDLAIAEHFGTVTGDAADKFLGIETELGEHGVPVLTACPHRLLLERIALLDDGGDHICLTARVRAAHSVGRYEPIRLLDVEHWPREAGPRRRPLGG